MRAFIIIALLAFVLGLAVQFAYAEGVEPELNPSRFQATVLRADGMAHDGQPVLETTDFGAKGFLDLDEGKDNISDVQGG
jgi:hypothetical protein